MANERTLHKFLTVGPSGQTREWESVKEAFDGRGQRDEVYVVLAETGSRYKVLRP